MQKFIDFTLPDGYGNSITLSEGLKDNNLLLFFYRGKW